ncbi:MAG: tail fiber protein [Bacteroidota bacterium]
MAQQYLGEVRMFGGNFAPRGWALCDGQLLSIAQNQALFSILGTTYGGDGRTTFALPDMRGRFAMHAGTGPGLTPRTLGQRSGQEDVTLTQNQIPSHNHFIIETTAPTFSIGSNGDGATENEGSGNTFAAAAALLYNGGPIDPGEEMGGVTVNQGNMTLLNDGGGQSHNNMQPYETINYIIALQGLFPSRS